MARREMILACLAGTFLSFTQAATRTYNVNITWVTANPDGAFARQVIGINGKWPIPTIEGEVGDTLVVHATNQLGDQSTSLHFHGLYMTNATHMDGTSQVSQCSIPPGSSFTYNFTLVQTGTYWYHSHNQAQYPDGLRGPLIVHDPDSPFKDQYDEERVLTVSDWYHQPMQDLLSGFIDKSNPTGAEPVPQSAIFNDTDNFKIHVKPGKTYLFRVINMGAFAAQYIWFEGHNMTIVEVDGVYTHKAEAEMIYITPAQRYSFLLTTRNSTDANYPVVGSMDTTLFDTIPSDLNWNATTWLVYDDSETLPTAAAVDDLDGTTYDDMSLTPYDNMTLLGEPDRTVELTVVMDNLGDGASYAFFNNITYKPPKVPTLYTLLSSGDQATDPAIYGSYTNSFVLEKDQIVQIVVNNQDTGRHPFHLHGHAFQAIHRSPENAGAFDGSDAAFPTKPMRRDTLVLYPQGNIVMRFKADNPGVWLFHCHIEWHVASGLMATMVEAPMELQRTLAIPQNHLDVCAARGVPTKGNAAGNAADLLDLSGQPSPPAPLPDGFTTRGIVALAFSCLAGILGVALVAWYGLVPDPAASGTP